ncbi:MAG TPA: hypothetical protein VFU11_09905 [Solirubrobacterales bacterium]|nr:hypothetical protein [Solirubrobacterales bacterium]
MIQSPSGSAWIAIEARRSLSPAEAGNLLPRLAQILRSMSGDSPVLIVAPWLSPRTQELLAGQGVNYLDQTGNALIKLINPAVYIETEGAARNPDPKERGAIRLRGPKVGRLIRTLVDVSPPYMLKDLADSTGLAPGYISRILDSLNEEAMIKRAPRGPVEFVDAPALLRRWAASYDVFGSNRATTYIAREGLEAIREALAMESRQGAQIAVTGSVAAALLSPVASPTLLLAYTPEPERLAQRLDLLPADEGANVGLLLPFDTIVWKRTRWDEGLQLAAASQVAVDCLTGNGRMPAEGEAILSWMGQDESLWRSDQLEVPGHW